MIELETTARTAEDAARSLGVPVGAIVKSLLFTIDGDPVMALVAGDRRCDTRALAPAFGRSGLVLRADAERVRQATGFVIGGVAPLGHPAPLPTAIDDSLGRFETVYAAAGHPFCVFPDHHAGAQPPDRRRRDQGHFDRLSGAATQGDVALGAGRRYHARG